MQGTVMSRVKHRQGGSTGAPQKTFHAGPTSQRLPETLLHVPVNALAIAQTHLLRSALLARLCPLALSNLLCRTVYSTTLSVPSFESFTGCSVVSTCPAEAAPQPSFRQPPLCVCQLQTMLARSGTATLHAQQHRHWCNLANHQLDINRKHERSEEAQTCNQTMPVLCRDRASDTSSACFSARLHSISLAPLPPCSPAVRWFWHAARMSTAVFTPDGMFSGAKATNRKATAPSPNATKSRERMWVSLCGRSCARFTHVPFVDPKSVRMHLQTGATPVFQAPATYAKTRMTVPPYSTLLRTMEPDRDLKSLCLLPLPAGTSSSLACLPETVDTSRMTSASASSTAPTMSGPRCGNRMTLSCADNLHHCSMPITHPGLAMHPHHRLHRPAHADQVACSQ